MADELPLPAHIDVNGDWDEVKARLYAYFEGVFKASPRIKIRGKVLVHDSRVVDSDCEEGFWHVVTKGKGEDRLFDPDRARRLCWIGRMLDGSAPGLTRWSFQEGDGTTKLYFWLEAEEYVLILTEKPKVVSLVTAFYASAHWVKTDLTKKRTKGQAF
ncbi:hypothetical protein GCM10007276_34660 [Agaricicola taiwanensis]|uniref:Uncharacterized protein n=1 Tax=Agaricicola taiwanensis TaxID=591372 RepID=A0A8J3E1R4_9RHOB|nr:hypothetical protein [Agaricicola taiwanensis]GGE54698.1 hypothetical protein GCM10007276_34660 [Agaricicola taiwanensis]